MKTNIAFLCIKSKFCKNICKTFCHAVEMMFADVDEILLYNLVDENMLNYAGKDYFEEQQQKVVKSIAECENICMLVDLVLINNKNNLQCIKDNCLVVYLRYSKEYYQNKNIYSKEQNKKQLIAFETEDAICQKIADISVDVSGANKKDCNEIIKKITQYYN